MITVTTGMNGSSSCTVFYRVVARCKKLHGLLLKGFLHIDQVATIHGTSAFDFAVGGVSAFEAFLGT